MKIRYLFLALLLSAVEVHADSSTLDAAIGGGIGGAAGAALGNEIGGRDGAIIGGALGGAVGAAVGTDGHSHQASPSGTLHYEAAPLPHYYHCPPGQRKKGRC